MKALSAKLQDWVVLAVDDHPDNLVVITRVFQFHGAQVYTGRNGAEGLALLAQINPTLCLVDLSMPIMSGWELFDAIRQEPRLAGVPIIAITAHAMDSDHQKVLEYGFDGYISKPFDVTTVVDEIRAAINAHASES